MSRDSRTIKIAFSLSRFGYRSIVVENGSSHSREMFRPVEVRTLGWLRGRRPGSSARDTAEIRWSDDAITRVKTAFKPFVARAIRERLHWLFFVAAYLVIRPVQGLFQVPTASLYYLHEYRLFPLVQLVRTLRRPVPFIYDAHDFYRHVAADDSHSSFWRKRFVPLLLWMERRCAADAAAVVTVSEGCADLFEREYGVRPIVIRNCHDQRLEKSVAATLRERVGLSSGDFLIAVLGNRKSGQAVEPMLRALTALPERVHVAFVGRFYDDTRRLAADIGVGGRVHAPGAVEPEQIVPFVRSADAAAILYFPETENIRSALPNGFFQSVSALLPLLYPDLPEIRRVVSSFAVGRQIDPLSAESLSKAVRWMLENEDEMDACRDQLRRLADAVSWEREEEKLRSLVERVINAALRSSDAPGGRSRRRVSRTKCRPDRS